MGHSGGGRTLRARCREICGKRGWLNRSRGEAKRSWGRGCSEPGPEYSRSSPIGTRRAEKEPRPVPTRATSGRCCVTGRHPWTLERAFKPDRLWRLQLRLTCRSPDALCLSPRRLTGPTLRLSHETDVALPPLEAGGTLIATRARAPDFDLWKNYLPARGHCQRPAEWPPRGGRGLDGSRPPSACTSQDR